MSNARLAAGAGVTVSGPDNRIEANVTNSNDFGVQLPLNSRELVILNSAGDNLLGNCAGFTGNNCGPVATAGSASPFTNVETTP